MIEMAWQMLLGLGVFLFGMANLEDGIRGFSGAKFKKILSHSTGTPMSSASTGILVTAILQSSSMVSLLVLAFASAGLMPLVNGIGILLGANLGTTATGWIVATLGFKLDLEAMAFPLLGLGGGAWVIWRNQANVQSIAQALLGLGMLLYGLSVMKAGVSELPGLLDISLLKGHNVLVYFVVGLLLTAIIQSSSATMMLTLAALNGGLVDLHAAAALVIGADLGTTSTTILGSLYGSSVKKRLAFSHCFYNIVVDLAALLILLPFIDELLLWLAVEDPLYGLVAFHSVLNLLGLLCFLPLLHKYANWIEGMFLEPKKFGLFSEIATDVADTAIYAAARQTRQFWHATLVSQQQLFGESKAAGDSEEESGFNEYYAELKQAEGDLVNLVLFLQTQPLSEPVTHSLYELLLLMRRIVYNNKSLKDIQANLEQMQHSSSALAQGIFQQHRDNYAHIIQLAIDISHGQHGKEYTDEELLRLRQQNDAFQQQLDHQVYQSTTDMSDKLLLSTLLNVNREMHHAVKSLLNTLEVWFRLKKTIEWPLEK